MFAVINVLGVFVSLVSVVSWGAGRREDDFETDVRPRPSCCLPRRRARCRSGRGEQGGPRHAHGLVAPGAVRHVRPLGALFRASPARGTGRPSRPPATWSGSSTASRPTPTPTRSAPFRSSSPRRASPAVGAGGEGGRLRSTSSSRRNTTTASRCTTRRSANSTRAPSSTAISPGRSWTRSRAEDLRVGFYHSVIDWHHDQYQYARSKQLRHPLEGQPYRTAPATTASTSSTSTPR